MKTLILIRHGKAAWQQAGETDFQRKLDLTGQNQAAQLGQKLKTKIKTPDLIACSTSVRTVATAKILAKQLNYPENKIQSEEALYLVNPKKLINFLRKINDDISTLVLVGHNPGLSELVQILTNTGFPGLATCGVAALKVATNEWHSINQAPSEILFLC